VQVGEVLAQRYRLEALLGWGGQAVVFQAVDLRQAKGKFLSAKVVRADLPAEARQSAFEVLRWEANLLRDLRHPALPRLLRFHTTPDSAWLIRDFAAGMPLSVWAQKRPCEPKLVQAWALQICDLLSYLHHRNPPIICSDLKPSNLILQPDGSLMLIDLGAALTYPQATTGQTTRLRYGTPGYAPPEQLGKWGTDERTDLFSLAVTCYELLTGTDPTTAPLQFDFRRLNVLAPTFASALEWALLLEPSHRVPTVAVFQALLGVESAYPKLKLKKDFYLTNYQELLTVLTQQPRLVEKVLVSGALEAWLARHPEGSLGILLHQLRVTKQKALQSQPALQSLLAAFGPADQVSPSPPGLRVSPPELQLGPIPLSAWQIWSPVRYLTLENPTPFPIRWALECPKQFGVKVRLLVEGCLRFACEGVIFPGQQVNVGLRARGRAGPRQGHLLLFSGDQKTKLPWQATAMEGLTIGQQFITRLPELDVKQPDLVPALKALLLSGLLQRWLQKQGEVALAAELALPFQTATDELTLRLKIVALFHRLAPQRFPFVRFLQLPPAQLQVMAGAQAQVFLTLENAGSTFCQVTWRSNCPWVSFEIATLALPPNTQHSFGLLITPPPTLAPGIQLLTVDLKAGDFVLPINLTLKILARRWWRRILHHLDVEL